MTTFGLYGARLSLAVWRHFTCYIFFVFTYYFVLSLKNKYTILLYITALLTVSVFLFKDTIRHQQVDDFAYGTRMLGVLTVRKLEMVLNENVAKSIILVAYLACVLGVLIVIKMGRVMHEHLAKSHIL